MLYITLVVWATLLPLARLCNLLSSIFLLAISQVGAALRAYGGEGPRSTLVTAAAAAAAASKPNMGAASDRPGAWLVLQPAEANLGAVVA